MWRLERSGSAADIWFYFSGWRWRWPCVGPAWGQASSFSDDLGSSETVRWSKGVHALGRSYLDPANVDVDDQNLRIQLPARSYEGGEVLSNELHGYGPTAPA